MSARSKKDIGLEERRERYTLSYDESLDPSWAIGALVIGAGDFLAAIFGMQAADAGMTAMLREGICPVERPWREAIRNDEVPFWPESAIGQHLFDVGAYAIYGYCPEDAIPADERPEYLGWLVRRAVEFSRKAPTELWLDPQVSDEGPESIGALMPKEGARLRHVVMLAENRWALDNHGAVEPAALAAFGGVAESRVRNLMAGAARQFNKDAEGKIPAHEALAWLSGREEFWNSIWRDQAMPLYSDPDRPPLAAPVFVPVAADGSIFHPGLERNGAYMIGAKDEEKRIVGFEEALAALQSMPATHWRRPNEKGNWGIVAGRRWERLDRRELLVFVENPAHRLPAR